MGPISEPSASGHVLEGPDVTRMETRSHLQRFMRNACREMTLEEEQTRAIVSSRGRGE